MMMRLSASHVLRSKASGTRVVLPAPGGACRSTLADVSSALTTSPRTSLIGKRIHLLYAMHCVAARRFLSSGMARDDSKFSSRALRVGIVGMVAFGAVVSGFLASRQGRRFVKDVWQGRRRTQLEDRVLDAIWGDRILGRRRIDVQELDPGVLALSGQVRSADERRWAHALVARVSGVNEIEDRLELRQTSK